MAAKKKKAKALPLNIPVLESSFAALAPSGEAIVQRFYEVLFAEHPGVQPLFDPLSMEEQQGKLLAALVTVVDNLNDPGTLVPVLEELGRRHEAYGAEEAHYGAVAGVLLSVLAEFAGDIWTDEVSEAWTDALNLIAKTMLDEYQQEGESNMAGTKGSNGNDDSVRMQAAVDNAITAMVMIDTDLNITYANAATVNLLTKHESVFQEVFPGFSAAGVLGTCIDAFHKNPEYQRGILGDLSQMPYEADINIGPLTFSLNVTAIVDDGGTQLGNCLEWYDVTAARETEETANRLRTAVDKAQTALVMIDRDFIITYANEATYAIFDKHLATLQEAYPGFDPAKVAGSCIDGFHKNPAQQRQLLSNPSSCPYSTDIQIGPASFALSVNAMMDLEGNHIGNTLEWEDVTEVRMKEADVSRLQAAVDQAQTPLVMIDRDFVITYGNQATFDIFKNNLAIFQEAFPGFAVDGVAGSCIDAFHKNPAHQRQLLADPNNCPYSTDIQIGPLTFNLNVNAMVDTAGTHVGNTLEWQDVTEDRRKATEVARLQTCVDGASTPLIMIDRDLVINYTNQATVDLLLKYEGELRSLYPGFSAASTMGTCIDTFHKNPAHQRRLLEDKTNLPFVGEIIVGPLTFTITVTAIDDDQGNYIGNGLEWVDITAQKAAQSQIEGLIGDATDGKLDERLQASDFDGFLKDIGEGINNLLDVVVQPIKSSTAVIRSMEEGDLTQQMTGDFSGEFGVMRDAVHNTLTNLTQMVSQIRGSSAAMLDGAAQIKEGNTNLNQRTQQQASALEECAATVEELTGTVKQNAENSQQANTLAANARELAEKGGEVVGTAVNAMAEINSSSKKISDIIGVIDEIAFQTNLLALNAAVEAARAGEQGRGFAVVATEVRNLAQRSAAAAKEIKALINDSVEKVGEGTRLVDQSGETLAEIVEGVKKTSEIIGEIAAASEEQASGIEQVSKAITQMDEMTQQNSALVEEVAAASDSSEEKAKGLAELMTFFTIDEAAGSGAPAAAARAAAAPVAPAPIAGAAAPAARKKSGEDWEDF